MLLRVIINCSWFSSFDNFDLGPTCAYWDKNKALTGDEAIDRTRKVTVFHLRVLHSAYLISGVIMFNPSATEYFITAY